MSEARKEPEWYEHQGTEDVVCPHCGENLGSDDWPHDGVYTCDECCGSFEFETEYSVTYTTRKLGPVVPTNIPNAEVDMK